MTQNANRTVMKANRFDPRVDLENKIVSLVFSDAEGKSVDVWVSPKAAFVVLAGLQRLIQDNPQIAAWAKPDPNQVN
jgi:hypothetical protein